MRLTGTSLGYGAVAYGAAAVYGARVVAASIAAGGYGPARRKRYVVRKDGQLLEFSSREAAEQALYEPPAAIEVPKVRAKAKNKASKPQHIEVPKIAAPIPIVPPAPPLQSLNIAAIIEMARRRGQEIAAQQMLARKRYEALLDLAWHMQDEEDIEMLLMAVH